MRKLKQNDSHQLTRTVPVVGLWETPFSPPYMQSVPPPARLAEPHEHDFERAGLLLRVLAAPLRLQIVSVLCQGEKNVGELIAAAPTTQPNMSQHLKVLYEAQIIDRRREGVQMYYRIRNQRVVQFCEAFCALVDQQSEAAQHPRASTVAGADTVRAKS